MSEQDIFTSFVFSDEIDKVKQGKHSFILKNEELSQQSSNSNDGLKKILLFFADFFKLTDQYKINLAGTHWGQTKKRKKMVKRNFYPEITPEKYDKGLEKETLIIAELENNNVLNFLLAVMNLVTTQETNELNSKLNKQYIFKQKEYTVIPPMAIPVSETTQTFNPCFIIPNLDVCVLDSLDPSPKKKIYGLMENSGGSILELCIYLIAGTLLNSCRTAELIYFVFATSPLAGLSTMKSILEQEEDESFVNEFASLHDNLVELRRKTVLLSEVVQILAKQINPKIGMEFLTLLTSQAKMQEYTSNYSEVQSALSTHNKIKDKLSSLPVKFMYVPQVKEKVSYSSTGMSTTVTSEKFHLNDNGTIQSSNFSIQEVLTEQLLKFLKPIQRKPKVKGGNFPQIEISYQIKEGQEREQLVIQESEAFDNPVVYDERVNREIKTTNWTDIKTVYNGLPKKIKIINESKTFVLKKNSSLESVCSNIFDEIHRLPGVRNFSFRIDVLSQRGVLNYSFISTSEN